jgi:signal transduction histidine kinase
VAAFSFVVVALLALAVAPALLLERVARVAEGVTTTVLPTYSGLRDFAFAMEARLSSSRSWFLTGDDDYAVRLERARAAEREALRTLEALAPDLSPAAVHEVQALQVYVARRDSLEAALERADGGVEAYRRTLPRFDALRDSMLVQIAGLRSELLRVTESRIAAEAHWAELQRTLSFVLGAGAVLAALLVGWFAWRQRQLRREVQHALAQAEQRRAELERVTESRNRLMRGFTHDVKNPLGAASGYLHLLNEGILGPLTEEQTRALERAGASIAAALDLVQDLLEIAQAEAGHLELSPALTDLRDLVRNAADEYRAQAEAKGLAFEVLLPDSVPEVVTDGRRVRQVLGNLISNAVKYTRSGRITVRLASPDGGAGSRRLAIVVEDTGPGIAPEQRPILFDEFVRLDPAAATGAGVGLTISNRIAEALGGEITVESDVGRGSAFTLWLPMRATLPAAAPQHNL